MFTVVINLGLWPLPPPSSTAGNDLSPMLRTAITASRTRPLPRPLPPCQTFSSTTRRLEKRYIRFQDEPDFSPPPGQRGYSPQEARRLTNLVGAWIGLAGGLYYVTHLEQVPQTGRRRFMNVSEQYEAQLGEEGRRQTVEEFGDRILPDWHPVSKQVHRVVKRILEANKLGTIKGETPSSPSVFGRDFWNPDESIRNAPSREWNVIVIHDKKIANAMATPGTIIVFTGILPVCQDDEGLASVLAHEIGHVVARHTAERASSATLALFAVFAISSLTGADLGLSSLVHSLLFDLPNSRKQESEADQIGLTLMSRACYDPNAAPQMFTRMADLEKQMGGSSISFLSTHPSSGSRIEALEKKLPEAYETLSANLECGGVLDHIQRFKRVGLFGGSALKDLWS